MTGLRLGLAERRLLLKGLDVAAVTTAWGLVLRPADGVGTPWIGAGLSLAALAVLWLIAAEGAEAYPPEASRPAGEALSSGRRTAAPPADSGRVPVLLVGPALVAGALTLLLHWSLAVPDGPAALTVPAWPHALGFLAALVAFPGALRLLARSVLAHPGLRPRVLVVGGEVQNSALVESLRRNGRGLYRMVGCVEEGGAADRAAAEADIVALRRPSDAIAASADALDRCVEAGVEVVALSELVERLTGRVPLDGLDAASGALPLAPPATRLAHRAAKRCLDLALVIFGLAFFLPALPLIAAAIRLETPGPVFYTQERVGRGGRRFRVFKLRSMVADAEAEGAPRWAEEDDPRITRVGRFLRATHLDEFPQMLNILKGEMSPVGPRPERPEFISELAEKIPHYRMRHAVRPGMAGWALVEHGYSSSLAEARRKHEYDLYYVKHQSVWLDLVVLARTLVDTFTLGGR